ncbi:MAG: hypothetical protein AAB669_01200 [Patescibacteria group bacterium]
MRWANFLHIYQPADQQPDILEAIVTQSYRPLLEGIRRHPRVRLTLNVSAALLELFDHFGYSDLIDDLRTLGREGRVEFTGTAKYHTFLPLLEEDEIRRQIIINNEATKHFLGDAYQPKGFFPPEMGYQANLPKILAELGFEWVILDEIALGTQPDMVDYTKTYTIEGTKLGVFFRQRRTSNMIMSALVRSPESFAEAMEEDLKSDRYLLTGMDGETLGHHRPGMEKIFFELLEIPAIEPVTVSDLLRIYPETVAVTPVASTWASSPEDIKRNVQFLSWHDPENPIHGWQWEFVALVLKEFRMLDQSNPAWTTVRQKLDQALASDHFWWASAKPWWGLEMIEVGAYHLLDIIETIPDVDTSTIDQARHYYDQIVSTAFQWQRSGKIRQMTKEQQLSHRIPLKDRTVGKGGAEAGVYEAFVAMMREREKVATTAGEYEKAILWRDAVYKLENGWDIYDSINVIDLLRIEIPNQEVEKTIRAYKDRYYQIRGGQPEQRGS